MKFISDHVTIYLRKGKVVETFPQNSCISAKTKRWNSRETFFFSLANHSLYPLFERQSVVCCSITLNNNSNNNIDNETTVYMAQ